jgi:hypothetical protein
MKIYSSLTTVLLGATLLAFPVSQAGAQSTMKECAAEWQKMKAAKATGGKTYKDFSKECMSKSSAAPAAAPAAAKPAPAAAKPVPAPAPAAAKPAAAPAATAAKPAAPATGGRAGEIARERACGADWKADKAANKIPAGMKWPQYWSECDKRKKAAGM